MKVLGEEMMKNVLQYRTRTTTATMAHIDAMHSSSMNTSATIPKSEPGGGKLKDNSFLSSSKI